MTFGPAIPITLTSGVLAVGSDTYVKLVDDSDNSPGSAAEAVYANSLIVGSGSTLDLNGLNLYVRAAQLDGNIVGGTVVQTPDSGVLEYGVPTPGSISVAGELDEWQFFGRKNHTIAVLVNPGSGNAPAAPAPHLDFAGVELVDASRATYSSLAAVPGSCAMATVDSFVLPADGNYRVRVRAAAGHWVTLAIT